MIRARAWLIGNQPFLGSLAMRLILVEDTSIDTFSTDGKDLRYNPACLDYSTDSMLQCAVAEIVMHCALGHHVRMGSRDLKRWNLACDYVVYPLLLDAGLEIYPGQRHLLEPAFKGMNAETIYKHLEEQEAIPPDPETGAGMVGLPEPSQGAEGGAQPVNGQPGGTGEVTPAAPGHDQGALAEAAGEWEVNVRQAVNVAKRQNPGSVPGFIDEIVKVMNEVKVDWRSVLRRFIEVSNTKDYSWTQPNRRMLSLGYVVPGLIPDGVGHVVLAIDTSASMDQEALAKLGGEVQGVLDEGAVDKVTVVFADTEVHRSAEYGKGDQVDFTCVGRGGTAFAPTFEWIEANTLDAVAVIYFTDLDCYEFGSAPPIPVLWACHVPEFREPPFGEVLVVPE